MSSPPITITQTGVGRSRVIFPDTYLNPFNIGVGAVITSGTATYSVEHTFDDAMSPTFNPATATWFANSGITAQTSNANSNYAYPVNGISINLTVGLGTVVVTLLQAGTR